MEEQGGVEVCPSETSRISALSSSEVESPYKDLKQEEKKKKRGYAEEELKSLEAKSDDNHMDVGSSQLAESSTKKRAKYFEKVVVCNYCKRQFHNLQALGGHQNAHKSERAIEKSRQEMRAKGVGIPNTYSYSSTSTLPLGSFNRSLGLRMDSLIHKPYPAWTPLAGLQYGPGRWSSPVTMNQHPSLDRLRMNGSGLRVPGITSFDAAAAAFRMFGGSPEIVDTNNAINREVGNSYLRGSGRVEMHQRETEELDLSLKL